MSTFGSSESICKFFEVIKEQLLIFQGENEEMSGTFKWLTSREHSIHLDGRADICYYLTKEISPHMFQQLAGIGPIYKAS